MAKVVFTEGKHDVEFLTLIHRANHGLDFDTFNVKESEYDQSTRIRQHKVDENIEYLYKSEGGKPEVIKQFRATATEVDNIDLTLLVDLDGDGISTFSNSLQNKLDEQYRGDLEVSFSKKEENAHLLIFSGEVTIQNELEGYFTLIAFRESLEDVTHIQYSEDRTSHRNKMKYYINNCPTIISDIVNSIG